MYGCMSVCLFVCLVLSCLVLSVCMDVCVCVCLGGWSYVKGMDGWVDGWRGWLYRK
jgi:hypothetical protein